MIYKEKSTFCESEGVATNKFITFHSNKSSLFIHLLQPLLTIIEGMDLHLRHDKDASVFNFGI